MTNKELFNDFWKFKLTDCISSIDNTIDSYFRKNYLAGFDTNKIQEIVLNLDNKEKYIDRLNFISMTLSNLANEIKNDLLKCEIYNTEYEKVMINYEIDKYARFQELKSKFIHICSEILNNNPYKTKDKINYDDLNRIYHDFWRRVLQYLEKNDRIPDLQSMINLHYNSMAQKDLNILRKYLIENNIDKDDFFINNFNNQNTENINILKELYNINNNHINEAKEIVKLYLNDNYKTCNTKILKESKFKGVKHSKNNPYKPFRQQHSFFTTVKNNSVVTITDNLQAVFIYNDGPYFSNIEYIDNLEIFAKCTKLIKIGDQYRTPDGSIYVAIKNKDGGIDINIDLVKLNINYKDHEIKSKQIIYNLFWKDVYDVYTQIDDLIKEYKDHIGFYKIPLFNNLLDQFIKREEIKGYNKSDIYKIVTKSTLENTPQYLDKLNCNIHILNNLFEKNKTQNRIKEMYKIFDKIMASVNLFRGNKYDGK